MENKRLNIIKEMVNDALLNARKVVNTNPTEKQAKAGNYRMGHVRIKGFEITIENPKGSYRKGKDANGKEWKTLMHNDYGYFTKTVGKDGDAIDVFIGPNLNSEKVYPIDQYWKGEFDETKVMLGFNSKEEAKAAYLSNYEKDWKGFKYITEVDIETFKKWLYDGYRQRKPFAKYVSLNESYTPMDSNPLHKTFISFGTNELDYSKFLPITTIMYNNKPYGGIWAAELHDEGGSDWKNFIENEMSTTQWIKSLQKHIIFKLSPKANIFVINGKQDIMNLKRILPRYSESPIDYGDLQKKGYDGIFLSEIGNRTLHNAFDFMTPNFNTWDIASICVFNPDVIEIIPENIIDFDKNMGDNGNPDDEKKWWEAGTIWGPIKRDDIKDTQMNRMWRQNGNLNIEPDMSKYFNGKQLALMAQEHGNSKDAKIARSFKGSIKESQDTKIINENLSSIVYHFTDLSGMWQIAKTDAFKLQHSLSTPSDSMSKRGNMNFISFTRDFSGKIGYSRGRNVRIKLDGDKLNQRYAGKAVSYWGASMGKNDYFANPETTISGKAKPIDRFQGRTENEDRLFTNEPIIDDFYDYIINVDVLLPSQESFMERALNMIRAIYSTGIGYYKMRVFDNEKDFNNPYSKNFLTYDSFYKKYGYNHELSVSDSSYEAGNKNRIGRYLSQLLSYIFRNEPLYSREERIKAGGKLLHQYGLEHFNKVVLNRIESLSSWDYDNIFGAIKSLRNECDNETWRKINRLIYDFTRKNNIKNAKDMRKWYKGAYGQVMEEKHRFITEKEVRERFRKELKDTIHRKISDAIKEKESK